MEQNEALAHASQSAGVQIVQTPQEIMTRTVIGNNGAAISEVLMAAIAKVKDNPDYIPQAIAIKDLVGGMIDLAKTEVATMVAVNNLQNTK